MESKKFINGEIYHIFNKSIMNFSIFKINTNCERFLHILNYYNDLSSKVSFSKYLRDNKINGFNNILFPKNNSIIKFLAYCVMPDHYHLLIKVINQDKVTKYLNDIGNSYTRFFNTKLDRKGPLWQSGYKKVLITNNEQLLHVTRYTHLNPCTAGLIDKPEDWQFSSYKDFIHNKKVLSKYITEISIKDPNQYKKFVEDNKDYQKRLKEIKKLLRE